MAGSSTEPMIGNERILFDPLEFERILAPWAARPSQSLGRPITEARDERTPHQRDRDRIIHSTAFRRLKHKTQVFVAHEGDHYRTRLTHTLEVAQITRSIARALRLNEDLAEAIALAHDLGHPPFGHAGERALDRNMVGEGGFDHNMQSLRVVTELETRTVDMMGLNLTWETLEGLAKHNGPPADPHPVIRSLNLPAALAPMQHASLEAQVAAIADDIAYNAHDIDDGLRAGLFDFAELAAVEPMRPLIADLSASRRGSINELMRRQITLLIRDVVRETTQRLVELQPTSAADIREANTACVSFSQGGQAYDDAIRAFLHERVYRHPLVAGVMGEAETMLTALFKTLVADPSHMAAEWRERFALAPARSRSRVVTDYIAGMTDPFARQAFMRCASR